MDLRHVQHVGPLEISLELGRIRCFSHQVELVDDRAFVLGDDLVRLHSLAVLPIAPRQPGQHLQHVEITLDLVLDTGPQDLDDHLGSILELCRVHLRYGRGCKRLLVEACEYVLQGLAIGITDDRCGLLRGKRRHRVLELGEFHGDIGRQQVSSRRDCLAELDEYRAKFLEREPNALTNRPRSVATAREEHEQETQGPQEVGGPDELVKTVLDQDALDGEYASQCASVPHVSLSPAGD